MKVNYQSKELHDLAILKDYRLKKKLILMKKVYQGGKKRKVKKGTVNDNKLENNIIRAKTKIREYAMCNNWEYFCTFTIDKNKFDRYNLESYHRTFAQWLRNYGKRKGIKISYLIVPEKHKDGAWHEHGLIMGLGKEELQEFSLNEKLPRYIRNKLLKGEKIYTWKDYENKFGYVVIEPIRNQVKVSNYITKYCTKELSKSVGELGAHLYYNSKGLKKAETIKRGSLTATQNWDFENDYVKIKWYDKSISDDLILSQVDSPHDYKIL